MGTKTTTINWPDTTYVQIEPSCPYCAAYHEGVCPLVEELEYYPDGALKRVKLRSQAAEIPPQPRGLDIGHTCGVDCPEITW